MIELPKNKALIVFDGICNLCNASVQLVIKNDKKNIFLFAPLQGQTAKDIISNYNIDTSKVDSILLYIPEKGLFLKSTAALKIAYSLGFAWNLLSFFIIIPVFIRDWIYDLIAKNRYKWFGKKETCMVPTEELKSKFLE